MCERVFLLWTDFDKNYVNFNFQNFKNKFYKVLNFTAPTAPTAPNSTETQKSSTSVEYFCFFELHLLHQLHLKLNWDTEIFDVRWVFCFFELHQTKKNTKIVKIFSAPMNLFLFFIFNYELDIFYPFFKNDKIAF